MLTAVKAQMVEQLLHVMQLKPKTWGYTSDVSHMNTVAINVNILYTYFLK
jgi:hypothetical protein